MSNICPKCEMTKDEATKQENKETVVVCPERDADIYEQADEYVQRQKAY